ncbi:hypothetical protein GCM10023189_30210 [Nibrella saemangeumensis]|uniref:Peptidyl-prolyl cis-trans isomerase n=1 Tax=Nibrella saemangeumensis TaxID=1084526 RepID=A0ABP8N1D7_9BACT
MRTLVNKVLFFAALASISFSVVSCLQSGEALQDRKRRENEQEIEQYIVQNNLRGQIQKNDLGLYYYIVKPVPNAQQPKIGDEVQYHYVARRLDNLIVDSTEVAANKPLSFVYLDRPVNITAGLFLGISQLKEGEEAILLVPSYLDNGRVGTLLLPQYSPVRYDLKVASVRTEDEQIEDYVKAKKLTITQKQDNGLRIAVTQSRPDSVLITTGKTVNVKYSGKLLTDKQFDAGTINVTIGEGRVVKGWEEALQKLRAGEKATVIFPSTLGYGTQGSGQNIGPYAPLTFDLEILSVK